MFDLTRWAAAAALAGGLAVMSAPASAAPVSGGATGAAGPVAEHVQYYGYGPGYGRPFYGPRPGFRRRYGPPVVCRFRPTRFGPQRVCVRRY